MSEHALLERVGRKEVGEIPDTERCLADTEVTDSFHNFWIRVIFVNPVVRQFHSLSVFQVSDGMTSDLFMLAMTD